MKVKEAITFLQDYDPEEEICMILWTRSDVSMWHYMLAEDQANCKDLTPDDIDEILSLIEREHDAEVGVSWDTIDDAIECHLKNQDNIQE